MKIGILTFHNTTNYGATLQAYALSCTLKSNGVDTVIVDYRNAGIENKERPKTWSSHHGVKNKVKWLIQNPFVSSKYRRFLDFSQKEFTFLSVDSAQPLVPQLNSLDAVVVGSDQVWNTGITDDDWNYFLPGDKQGLRKYSYAASFGQSDFNNATKQRMAPLLKDFDALSVREQEGTRLAAALTGEDVIQVVDPTLLLAKNEWMDIAEKVDGAPSKYVVVYAIAEKAKAIATGKRIAAERGAKLVIIHSSDPVISKPVSGAKNYYSLSPAQFVWLFQHADYTVTGSFHGLCFSVLMECDCSVILNSSKHNANSRVFSLLQLLGLEDIAGEEIHHIDYAPVRARLNNAKESSLSYLNLVLGR